MNPQTEKKEMVEFVEAINTKQWNKALEISNALVYDDLQWKGLLNVGLLIAHYHINNGKIPLAPIDACLNRPKNGIYDGCLTEIKKEYPDFDVVRICIESVLVSVNKLESEGKLDDAYRKLKKNGFYHFTAFFPREEEKLAFYEKDVELMYKLNRPDVFYAARAMKMSGFELSKQVIDILQSAEYKQFEEDMQQFSHHEIKKAHVVFNADIHFRYIFDSYWIQSLFYPELKDLKKWVFKKNLIIDADFPANNAAIEVRGDTKISGSLTQVDGRTGASMLFKGNLEVGKGIKVGGYTQECSGPVSFTCNGELKAPLLQIYAPKVKLNGSVDSNTLIVILSKKDAIEDLPCRMYTEINEKFRTAGRTGIPNVIDQESLLTALQQGENVFTK